MNYFITSIPKSGTHLLASIVQEATGTYPTSVKKQFDGDEYYRKCDRYGNLVGHLRARQVARSPTLARLFAGRRTLILIRDPRAICNSMLHFLDSNSNPYHQAVGAQIAGLSFDEKIIRISKGIKSEDNKFMVPELAKTCSGFVEMAELYPDSVVLRYEDFFNRPLMTEKLAAIFEIEAERAQSYLANALAGGSRTKREGDPQGWRAAFGPELNRYFDAEYGALLTGLGYS